MGATVGETVKKRGVDFAPYRLNLSLTPQHGSILLEKERIEDRKSCESGDLRLRYDTSLEGGGTIDAGRGALRVQELPSRRGGDGEETGRGVERVLGNVRREFQDETSWRRVEASLNHLSELIALPK
jgi:hypothetical protein